jgi:outer membrane protein TolC
VPITVGVRRDLRHLVAISAERSRSSPSRRGFGEYLLKVGVRALGPVALILMCAAASFAEEPITVETAVTLALRSNRRLLSATKRAAASHSTALSVGSRLLPSVHLSEEYQHWDCAASIELTRFGAGAQCPSSFTTPPPPDLSAFSAMQQLQLGALLSPLAGPPITVRAQDTNSFSISFDQPLVGLLHAGFDYAAARANARANDASVEASRAAVIQLVRTLFLQYFEARAQERIAAASVTDLDEQVKVARLRLTAGVITNADLLRVEVAAANARQQQIAAEAQAIVSKTSLLDAVGLAPDLSVELVEPATLLAAPSSPLPDAQAALRQADARRPEIAQARLMLTAATQNRRARDLSLLPEVDAEGAYLRVDGQLFVPANQWFVGARASWAIWEWGATWFQTRAAAQQAEASAIDLDNQRRAVAVDVLSTLAQTRAAAAAVEVAEKTISSAEEAYRVTRASLQVGAATTTDLLDAQAALTTARLNLARAKYELAIQRVALVRVTGE